MIARNSLWSFGGKEKYKIPAPKRKRDEWKDLNSTDHEFTYDSSTYEPQDWYRVGNMFCFYPFLGVIFITVGYTIVTTILYGDNNNDQYWESRNNIETPFSGRESLMSRINEPINMSDR